MSSYETEHDIKAGDDRTAPRRRPDLSTFLSSFNHIDTSQTQNPNIEATPADVAAVLRNAAEWYGAMRQDQGDVDASLISSMIEQLWNAHDHPPTKVKGVSDEFLADLDRVPRKALQTSDICPICSLPFLDDSYPLVVRLPCHKTHMFDLECLQPWLKMNNSCPLDRKQLEKPKTLPVTENTDEEEYDSMYG